MGQLSDRFNNSAASLVAMCGQSNNAKLLIATYGELLTAVEVLEDQLAAQIVRLQGLLPGPPVVIIPTNISVPTISGTAQVNQVLTATPGTWTNNPTSYSYQWTDSSTGAIGGATASTYAPVSANLGHTLTVSVIATNSGGSSAPATSAATGVVTASGNSSTPYVVLLAA